MKFLILILLSMNAFANSDNKVRESIIKEMIVFLKKENILKNNELFKFKEKPENSKKAQDQVFLKRYLKGYLGAKYNNNIKKLPYAYAYLVYHSSGEELKNIKENIDFKELYLRRKNNKYSKVTFTNKSFNFTKINKDKYLVEIFYYLEEEKSHLIKHKMIVDIKSRIPFYFMVNKSDMKV